MASCDPDWEVIRKFRYKLPQVYTDLCISQLCELLNLNVDIWRPFFNKHTCYSIYSTIKKNRPIQPVVTHQLAVEIEYLIQQLGNDSNLKTRLLFRKPSSKARSKRLRALLAERRFAEIELGRFSPCDLADVLKRILRDAQEPLLTSAFYVICCQVQGLVKPRMERYEIVQAFQKQLWVICILFLMLPEDNYHLMRELLLMLHKIDSLREHNNMDAHSLAVCLAPALICPREFSMEEFHLNSSDMVWVLEFMVENAPSLFVVPRQLVREVKVQLARQWSHVSVSELSIGCEDQTFSKDSDSSSSISSAEYMEPYIEKLPKRDRCMSDTDKKKVHKFISTSKSWSFNDLRACPAEDVEVTFDFEEISSIAPCAPTSPEELDTTFLDELDTCMSSMHDLDATKNCRVTESFWSKRTGFFRKLFPGKERKNKSLNKKKRWSWFSGFNNKENVKMPPGGYAGAERGLNGIHSYRPSATEVQNRVDQSCRDSNHNLVPGHLRLHRLGKVDSRYGDNQTLKKSTTRVEDQPSTLMKNNTTRSEKKLPVFLIDKGSFKNFDFRADFMRNKSLGANLTSSEMQLPIFSGNLSKKKSIQNLACFEDQLSPIKQGFSENASSPTSEITLACSKSYKNDSWIITRRNSSVSSYCNAFRLQENRDWFESLESPCKKSDDFQESFPNSPLFETFKPNGTVRGEKRQCSAFSFKPGVRNPFYAYRSAGTDSEQNSAGSEENLLDRPLSESPASTEDLPFRARYFTSKEKKMDVHY